jgi:hypothetical protein
VETLTLVVAKLSASPDPNGLPGSNVVEQIVNGLFFYALLACLGTMLVGGGMWGLAAQSHNSYYTATGKKMVVGAFVGAIICGAAPAIINFAQGLGGQV